MKVCTKCNVDKELECFHNKKKGKHGKHSKCKECIKEESILYHRTKDGLVTHMYGGQIARSKKRKHHAPLYSKKELKEWLFSQTVFHELFNEWKVSNFNTMKAPSVDRLDDNLGYSFPNIQLITWKENLQKAPSPKTIVVIQMTKDNVFLNEFESIIEASCKTKVDNGHITHVCKGQRKTAGGFKWIYKR